METPLNFAVVGCGTLARMQHVPNIANSRKAVLHTCCDLDDDALVECRDRFGAMRITKDYTEAIADPEVQAICLATTEKVRLPVIQAAAEAHKGVYCEKPLASTLDEMRRIRKVVHESGIPFCIGHNRRSSPAMIEAHRIFRGHMENPAPCPWRFDRPGRPNLPQDGVAGMSVRINDDWHTWKNWVFDPQQAPYGPMIFEMTHFTDLCNWFLAAEPEEVAAVESGMLNHGVVIRYKTGEMATISMCANGTFGYPKELYELFGNGGAVVIDHMLEVRTAGIEGQAPRITYPIIGDRHPGVGDEGGLFGWLAKKRAVCKEIVDKDDPSLIFAINPDKGHAHAIDRFVDEILGRGPVVCGVDDAVLATEIAFAAVKAARERRVVRLDELREGCA